MKRILDNLQVIFEKYGSDMDYVVKVDVVLKNWADRNAMNEEYVKTFQEKHITCKSFF